MLLGKILLGAVVGLAASTAFGLVLFSRVYARNHAHREDQ